MRFIFVPVLAVIGGGWGSDVADEPRGVLDEAHAGGIPATAIAPLTTSSTTTRPTRQVEVQKYTLRLNPRFIFGVKQFRRIRSVRPDQVALCPSDKTYCIDSRYSDQSTCMFPAPVEVKKCLDRSCESAPENVQIFAQYGEPSYCKDYMAMPEGRICHWGSTFCSCPEFGIEYANALIQVSSDPIPAGFRRAAECVYPDDYKAENRHEGDARTLAPVPQAQSQPRLNKVNGASPASTATLAALIMVTSMLAM